MQAEPAKCKRIRTKYAPKTTRGRGAAATRDFKAHMADSSHAIQALLEQNKRMQQQMEKDEVKMDRRLQIEDQRYEEDKAIRKSQQQTLEAITALVTASLQMP